MGKAKSLVAEGIMMFTGDMGGVRRREILSPKLNVSSFSKSYRGAFEEYVPPHSPTRKSCQKQGHLSPSYRRHKRRPESSRVAPGDHLDPESVQSDCHGLPLMGILDHDSP